MVATALVRVKMKTCIMTCLSLMILTRGKKENLNIFLLLGDPPSCWLVATIVIIFNTVTAMTTKLPQRALELAISDKIQMEQLYQTKN